MTKVSAFLQTAAFFFFAFSIVHAGHAIVDTTLGGQRIELHVVPAEPFFTKEEVSKGKVTEGMLIMGGAKPAAPDAASKPNHHLVIHVYDAKTAKAITNAKVKMSFQAIDEKGHQTGKPTEVPVIVMQAIGKGAQSTHYGNNVVMPDGSYIVSLVVNGTKINLKTKLPGGPVSGMEEMHKH